MANKKLIEVALPLEAINTASAREKSIRHGHPSTLHLWWARRPLAAARAVIWASLVDDPSSHPEQFPTEEEQNTERQRLFKILEDLVVWENSNNQEVLEAAKAEIMKSTNNNPPALLDPFAGGGAIPLEAQRLGLEAHAHDLNPVAVTLNKAIIEIPPKFDKCSAVNPDAQIRNSLRMPGIEINGLAEDIRYYGEQMRQRAFEAVGDLYPRIRDNQGQEYTVIAWIWARTVASPDPVSQGAHVPLVSSLMLSSKKGNKAWVEIIEDENSQDGWRFEVKTGDISKADEETKKLGTKAGKAKDFICCLTKSPIQRTYIQAEGKAGRLSKRLMAIVALGKSGRVYFSPNRFHEEIALSQDNIQAVFDARESFLSGNTPTRAMVTGGVCSAYGLSTWGKLFTGRQIVTLTTFSSLVTEIQKQVEFDAVKAGLVDDHISLDKGGVGARAYGEAIGVYLSFAVDKIADIGSSACSWITVSGVIRNTFARQAIPMVWDFAESNPFSESTGCLNLVIDKVAKCVAEIPCGKKGHAIQFDAQSDCHLHDVMVSTDPPYYDNISYAELSDFFYVWMRQILKSTYPELFRTVLVPKAEELVATPFRFGGSIEKARDFFEEGMLHTCQRIYEYAREDIPVTIYYAYKQSDTDTKKTDSKTASTGWETMLTAIIQAGFSITGTWPMRTEKPGRTIEIGANALASSIILVCRKRDVNAPVCTRRNFISLLKKELRPALEKLQASNIAPVDLAQSAIGPGMGVFSRFSKVLEADGTPMTVRSALQIINQELDIYFNEQDGELDRESRFCVELYTQYAFNDVKFGDADTLARAKNTSVLALATCGVMYAQQGTVHLYGRDELSDKALNNDSIIWLLTQQLTKAMETGGIEACARIVAPMLGSNAEYAKSLAYRLYTIAERKGWAQEAYAYNSLVIAWSDIQSRAAQIQAYEPEQLDLFSMGFMNKGGE